jgi:hypothetical protein
LRTDQPRECRDDDKPHDRRVNEQRHCDPEAHLLEGHELGGGKSDEDTRMMSAAPVISRAVYATPCTMPSAVLPVCW